MVTALGRLRATEGNAIQVPVTPLQAPVSPAKTRTVVTSPGHQSLFNFNGVFIMSFDILMMVSTHRGWAHQQWGQLTLHTSLSLKIWFHARV